jgi:hypothetical protein
MLSIIGAVANFCVLVLGTLVKVLTGLTKMLTGLVRAILPAK